MPTIIQDILIRMITTMIYEYGVVGMGTYASYYHKAWLGRTAQVTYGGDVGIQN